MPHFVIPLLGHGTVGGFLDSGGIDIGVTGLTGTRTVTGTPTLAATLSESFVAARAILDNILSGGELPETFRESITTTNLLGLGQASLDISGALSEQVAIREEQLSRTNDAILNQQLQLNAFNERVSKQLSDLGIALGGIGEGGFDPIKFFTDNPLFLGLGVGGLAVAGVVLLLVLR